MSFKRNFNNFAAFQSRAFFLGKFKNRKGRETLREVKEDFLFFVL